MPSKLTRLYIQEAMTIKKKKNIYIYIYTSICIIALGFFNYSDQYF